LLHKLLSLFLKRDWDDFASLPAAGPAIVVSNHLTSFDAVIIVEYILYHGRYPYILAKSTLWNVPMLGALLRDIDMIPVSRGTAQASDSLAAAREKLAQGKIVFIFPEGTTTRDTQMWPFSAKTGAARLAIETGAPVIPFGHWGASTICPDNAGPQKWPHLLPRHWVCIRSGDPIDMSPYGRDVNDREAVRAASAAIIAALVPLVEDARGEVAPPLRWNPKTESYVDPALAVW